MNSKYQAFLLILASVVLTLIIYLNLPSNTLKQIVSQSNTWTLIAAGDVMLGRTVMIASLDMGKPMYPFLVVADRLKQADIAFANLESPIVTGCPRTTTGFKFCTDPQMVQGLTFAGIDVVTLANNHIENYGNKGVEETKNTLAQNKIGYTLNSLYIQNIKNTKVGFIGFNLVDRTQLTQTEVNLIKESKAKVDILIVTPHWGYEYQSTASKFQQLMAQTIVDSGADLIIGSHPHWVQNSEYIQGKPVYYSLGNFVFDQMWSEKTRNGLVVKFEFQGNKLMKEEKMEIYMNQWSQPTWK